MGIGGKVKKIAIAKKDGFGHEKPYEGNTNDWITPKWIIDSFSKESDGEHFFDLDPCASLTQPWACAKNSYTEKDNGLIQKWNGTVWLNQPYGSNVGLWAEKLANHGDGVMLIFARVETSAWFDKIFPFANGFLFPRGRIVFHLPDGSLPRNKKGHIASAGAPSVLVAYGERSRIALINLCRSGMVDEFGVFRQSVFFPEAYVTKNFTEDK